MNVGKTCYAKHRREWRASLFGMVQ